MKGLCEHSGFGGVESETVQMNQQVLENGDTLADSLDVTVLLSKIRHELSHNPPPRIPAEPTFENHSADPRNHNPESKDDVFHYHRGFMNMALLLRNLYHLL